MPEDLVDSETLAGAQADAGPSGRFTLRHAIRSDIGRRRTENQDAFAFNQSDQASLFIVCDGMGGARGGATASALAVNIIARKCIAPDGSVTEESLRSGIEWANAAIFEASRQDENLSGMGTTVVALAVVDSRAIVAHVGDSRIYMCRDGEITQLTRDHTLVQELVETGAISPAEAANHPIAHMLTRSLGPSGAVEVEVRTLTQDLKLGDKFLLCCDGLYNLVADDEIRKVLLGQEIDDAADTLINLANERGGTDNITVEIVHVAELVEAGKRAETQPLVTSAELIDFNYSQTFEDPVDNEQAQIAGEPGESDEEPDVDAEPDAPEPASPPQENSADRFVGDKFQVIEDDSPTLDETLKLETIGSDEVPGQVGPAEEPKTRTAQLFVLAAVAGLLGYAIYTVTKTVPEPAQGRTASTPTKAIASATPAKPPSTKPVPTTSGTLPPPPAEEPGVGERAELESELNAAPAAPAQPSIEPAPTAVQTPAVTPVAQPDAAPKDIPVKETAAKENKERHEGWPATAVVPPEAARGPSVPSPEEIKIDDEIHDVAKAVALSSNLEVPEPPVTVPAEKQAANEPIVWEHEKALTQKISTVETKTTEPSGPRQIFSEQEKLEIVAKKIELRDKISDIDAKLKAFEITDKRHAGTKEEELNKQLGETVAAIDKTKTSLETAKRRLEVWQERSRLLRGTEPSKLAEEISFSSVSVKRKKEAYEVASLRYSDAVELWRENPSDAQAAGTMAALGRELKNRRIELEETVKEAVQLGVKQGEFDVSEFALVLSDLDRRRERLNRNIGVTRAFIPSPEKTRLAAQRSLLDERAGLKSELDRLRQNVSDEEEVELRRAKILKDLNIKVPR